MTQQSLDRSSLILHILKKLFGHLFTLLSLGSNIVHFWLHQHIMLDLKNVKDAACLGIKSKVVHGFNSPLYMLRVFLLIYCP